MHSVIKFDSSRRHRTALLGLLFYALIMVILPISAHAQCAKQWDASGEWDLRHGARGGLVIRLDLTQSGNALSGKASRDGGIGAKAITGNASGTADGDTFSFAIQWPGNDDYVSYKAKVTSTGKLAGETYIGANKRNRDTWYSDQPLTCGWAPGKSRGNLTGKLSATAPVKTGQGTGSLLKGPTLVVSQSIFPTPFHPHGFVILTWDAGPAHPNADLWVKYDGSRERVLVLKQPTGGQQIPVQRGRMYNYVLMDGRTVLASTTFVAH